MANINLVKSISPAVPWFACRGQAKFDAQARQSERNYVSGETHFFLGRRYRLNVIAHKGAPRLSFRNNATLDFHVRENSETAERQKAFQRWYRRELREIASPLIERWAQVVQVPIPQWGIKRMKTKWGSCNIEGRRIWLNLELIKKPHHCLEYVIAHEMVHFLERHHNDRFVALMDNLLPRWTYIREELNVAPLGHETWA